MKAAIEISIILSNFNNSEIFFPGFYQMKFQCYTEVNGKLLKALPICIESLNPKSAKVSTHNVKQGSIDEEEGCITTKVFAVRFAEEKIKLNEILSFYLEADKGAKTVFVKVTLLYSKFSKKALKSEQAFKEEFNTVIEIRDALEGVFEFFPLSLKSKCLAEVEGIVSICLYDYVSCFENVNQTACFLFPDKNGNTKKIIGGQEIDKKYSELFECPVRCISNISKAFRDAFSFCGLPEVELPSFRSFLPSSAAFNSFAESLENHSPGSVTASLLEEISALSSSVYQIFTIIKYNLSINLHPVVSYLKQIFTTKLAGHYKSFIFNSDLKPVLDLNPEKTAFSRPENLETSQIQVQSSQFFANTLTPLIFEKRFVPVKPSKSKIPYEFHIVVLVHGFQGSSFDVYNIKDVLTKTYPNLVIFDSTINEDLTDDEISKMGERLSIEIADFISYNFSGNTFLLSFIGHSLGGLIIRSAIPLLELYSANFYSFITLSTPHLGLFYSSKLLETGIWLMQKVKKIESLKQISMGDSESIENTFLYGLSFSNGLQWFSYVVLVGSHQDDYAPVSSAHIECCEKSLKDAKNRENYIKMAENLLEKISVTNVIKLDVHFKLSQSIDTIIGRSAHMELLENKEFLSILAFGYPELFI